MKKIALTTILLLLISYSVNAKARIPVCFPCEYIETTVDLPAETDFIGENEEPLNIGYRYKQINILWIPFWNYDGEYCLVNETEDIYYALTEEEKTYLTETHKASFEGSPLGLWDKLGGKAILAVILLLIIWGYMRSKNDKEKSDLETSES